MAENAFYINYTVQARFSGCWYGGERNIIKRISDDETNEYANGKYHGCSPTQMTRLLKWSIIIIIGPKIRGI